MRSTLFILTLGVIFACCKHRPAETPVREKASAPIQAGGSITQEATEKETSCLYLDGKHDATVKYHNPKTGHIATYDLKVHVLNCQVIRIDFDNGGWLDEDHIKAKRISDDGEVTLQDEKGRTWNVRLH